MNASKTIHRLLMTALLVFSVTAMSSVAMGQVILFVSQPSSIAGPYTFGPGDAAQGWGYSYDTIQVQAPLVRGFSSNAGGDSLACDTTL
ncbi:MAG: hypothetical protein ACKOHH_00620, partial [Bacteroidota bacterium]